MPSGVPRKTKIIDGIQYNQCTKCEEWFSATTEYFSFRNDQQQLYAKCRKCMNPNCGVYENGSVIERKRRKIKVIDEIKYQQCTKCEEWFPATREYFYYGDKPKTKLIAHCINCDHLMMKHYRENNKEKTIARKKKYNRENKEKIAIHNKKWRVVNKKKILADAKIYSYKPALFASYTHKLTIEEDSIEGEDGLLLVKCAYCGKYFNPITSAVAHRLQGLKNMHFGECRLYCSDGCKKACPIYKKVKYPKGFKKASSREVDPLIRQMCLKRDDYTCQKCEKTIEEIELHCHHIEGAVQQPMLANDVDNTITLCKPCHIWIHQQDGCTYYNMECNN